MSETTHCWFKRELNSEGSPKGEWEEGTFYGFYEHGRYGMAAIVSAKNDAATLVIPFNSLGICDKNPDEVKADFEKAKAAKAAEAEKAEHTPKPSAMPKPVGAK